MAEGNASLNNLIGAIEKSPPVKVLQKVTTASILEGPGPSYPKIQDAIRREIEITAKNFPHIPKERVRSIFIPYFGPLLFTEGKLRSGEGTLEDKELNARTQHTFTELIYAATQASSSDRFSVNMYDHVRRMSLLCGLTDFGKDFNLLRFWNGMKAELAVVRALRRNDAFDVLIPDPTQNLSKTHPNDNEVLQWDVRSGVDLIAIPTDQPKHAFLVDVKGRKLETDNGMPPDLAEEKTTVSATRTDLNQQQFASLNPCVKKTLSSNGITTVSRARVEIPTAGGYLGTTGNLPKFPFDDDYRSALEKFTSLRPDLENQVRTGLNTQVKQAVLVAA